MAFVKTSLCIALHRQTIRWNTTANRRTRILNHIVRARVCWGLMLELSRREWAGTLLAGALLQPSDLKAAGAPMTYAVIGAGVFGAWTAYHLRRAGHDVTLLDQYGPASSRASSGGETRIIRASYGPDEVYTRMAMRSLGLWTTFFAETGQPLLHRTGVLWMAKSGNHHVEQSRKTLMNVGVSFHDLTNEELNRRYPQIHVEPGTVAISSRIAVH